MVRSLRCQLTKQKHAVGEYNTPEGTKTWLAYNESRNKFGYYIFGNIGYRHVSNKGFLFRAGFSPSFTMARRMQLRKHSSIHISASVGHFN